MLEKDSTNKMVRNNIKRRQKQIEIQIKTRKWRWIGHTLRKTEGKTSTRLEPAGSQTERTSQDNLEEADRRRN